MKLKHKISCKNVAFLTRKKKNVTINNIAIHETIDHVDNKIIKGFIKEISFEDIMIKHFNLKLTDNISFDYKTNCETIEIFFVLEGNISQRKHNSHMYLEYQSENQSIIYNNGIDTIMEINSQKINVLKIDISSNIFLKYLPTEIKQFKSFAEEIQYKNHCIMGNNIYKINNHINSIINKIINCNLNGHFKKMYLKSKVIKLLLTQLQHQVDIEKKTYSLKNQNINKIYEVRDYLLKNLHEELTLSEIAKTFGTNINILKTGFREVFNTTIFKFIHDKKMEQARQLLETKCVNIKEVAYMLGYSQPQHFTSAFKKKYGILPSKIKKEE
ncbi:helix-turn-helix transcriptional regulator [Elizabethkingia anophelis]|uniref:helix-turn-helix transcriptional regulator n=1 Tax=Elizabethkingia anophelis TaxID=1117645 RepID=UPI0013704706|nr:AraC family transcriptional regulator [Elizabethkingia anophelis]MYY27391.1 AraC family transcriptional regulator [Elizabethkingia anophelis]